MKINGYETHAFADIFPMLPDDEIQKMAASLRANGQQDPIMRIWVPDPHSPQTRRPLILDGRNRMAACEIARVNPVFADFEGTEQQAFDFVVAKNLDRRHLSESQRAMVAARLATMARGRPAADPQDAEAKDNGSDENRHQRRFTQPEAAGLLGVGVRTVGEAKKVIERAEPELVAAVTSGAITVKEATRLLERPADEQRAIVEHVVREKEEGVATPSVKRAERAVDGPDLSQWFTDPVLAARLVALLGDAQGLHVLEPAAGSGNIVRALLDAGARVTAYELDPHYVDELQARFAAEIAQGLVVIIAGSFITAARPPKPYDACVQNPPFEDGLDGLFVAGAMAVAPRVVVLARQAVLSGRDRYDQVWSRCQPGGEWAVRRLRQFPKRPVFKSGHAVGARIDEGASKTDFSVAHITRRGVDDHLGEMDIAWWIESDEASA